MYQIRCYNAAMGKGEKPISLYPLKPEEALGALLRTPPPKTRNLVQKALGKGEDWVGNNAAFTCPECGKVFLVSGLIHRQGRPCPGCERSIGKVSMDGKTASLESSK